MNSYVSNIVMQRLALLQRCGNQKWTSALSKTSRRLFSNISGQPLASGSTGFLRPQVEAQKHNFGRRALKNLGSGNPSYSARYFSSDVFESTLDEILDPAAKCSLFGTPQGERLKKPAVKYLECGLREDKLRFRTVHYGKLIIPPHIHRNEHRVTLLMDVKDLPLDKLGKQILQQVIGINRYNVERGQVKVQANHFPSRIENKRYLVRMFDKLLLSCQRLSKSLPEASEEEVKKETGELTKELAGESANAV